ncbi:MAG: twin-arginine translocase TatA/TatE family subunit [Anaerolineaceae bacterium]|jgi:sec-independent protein translocase protein TatA|nr:twin-arginine translocase TatA/TatE family subunit [Anaerolineaceae bacterium]MDD4041924.1 twin-arginine translocase TatA/TatE family subunit [Anaerolineaceae bacterium]MDD4577936.1 twin-arginine translocase TatA/TatE family subunit [Anaerolineaceae bacterium]
MGSLQLPEILLIVGILLLIFGVGRISKIGGELGSGIKAFKDGLSGKNNTDEKTEEEVKNGDDKPQE